MSNFPELEADVARAPTVKLGEYEFQVFSIGERGTLLKPALLHEVVAGLIEKIHEKTAGQFDSIVTIHVTGAMWALPVALLLGKPLYVFTTEPNGIPGQATFKQNRPYEPRNIYSPDLRGAGRCIIIDDVVSGGGTLNQIASTVRDAGGVPVGSFVVIDKGASPNPGVQSLVRVKSPH